MRWEQTGSGSGDKCATAAEASAAVDTGADAAAVTAAAGVDRVIEGDGIVIRRKRGGHWRSGSVCREIGEILL